MSLNQLCFLLFLVAIPSAIGCVYWAHCADKRERADYTGVVKRAKK
jgi:hypothetical protein